MSCEELIRRRIKLLTWFFIVGLVISGATAIPLRWEVEWLAKVCGLTNETSAAATNPVSHWLLRIRESLNDTNARHPFLFYGTDWLAFGHFVIAIGFIGALRDPVRNRWLFDFGLIACALLIPFAMIFGALRGIPFCWRLIDCAFGVFGFVPLWFCRKWAGELETKHSDFGPESV
jgi:hypothetical protein